MLRPLGALPGPGDGVGRRERDARREDVPEGRRLVRPGPIPGAPRLEGLGLVVTIHLHEARRGEEPIRDVRALAVQGLEADSLEGRQQHGHIEALLPLLPVQEFHRKPASLDALDMGLADPSDPPLGEQGFGEDIAGSHVAVLPDVDAAHTEIAELVFIGQVGDVGLVAHPAGPQFELEVHQVLEGRSLAGAGAMPRTDQEPLPVPLLHAGHRLVQGLRSLQRMRRRAYGQAVALGAEPRRGLEGQLGSGGIDQVVVRDAEPFPRVALHGGFRFDKGRGIFRLPFGVEDRRLRQVKGDVLAGIDGLKREHDLAGLQ